VKKTVIIGYTKEIKMKKYLFLLVTGFTFGVAQRARDKKDAIRYSLKC
jgi:hypothetical protein